MNNVDTKKRYTDENGVLDVLEYALNAERDAAGWGEYTFVAWDEGWCDKIKMPQRRGKVRVIGSRYITKARKWGRAHLLKQKAYLAGKEEQKGDE